MHSKSKGNIAQSQIILDLHKNEFNVFTENGDYSKIDIIAEKNGKFKRIQVKFFNPKKDTPLENKVVLSLVKSGPNGYRYTYNKNDVDWFAIYSPTIDKILWISSIEACKNDSVTFHLGKPKNNQTKGIRLVENYGIEKFLEEFK